MAGAMDEVANHLIAYSTVLTASNCFRGYLPETSGLAVAVFETGGLDPFHNFAGDLPGI